MRGATAVSVAVDRLLRRAHMAPGVLVPAEVIKTLRNAAAVGSLTNLRPTIGGFSNLSFFGDCDSGETVVVKVAIRSIKRGDLQREARMLPLLAESALPLPFLRAHIESENWTISVLNAVAGDVGINVVQTRDVGDLCARARVMARLLQAIHQTSPMPVIDGDLDCGSRFVTNLELLNQRALPEDVMAFLASGDHAVLRRGSVLVHGDFGFHNTIWKFLPEGRVAVHALLDWEWSGWGSPLVDSSWLWWTLRFRRSSTEVWESFVDTYQDWALRACGWNPENVREVIRAQMASLLSRTEPGSPAENEWLTRIRGFQEMTIPTI
jgi:aminoglycoside phosphotransferase (APT) family kinase protein